MQANSEHGPRRSVGELRDGVMLIADGATLLARERGLWPLASLPVLLAVVSVGAASALFWVQLDWIHQALTSWLPALEATSWWSWAWVGPARVLLWLIGWIEVVIAFGVAMVAALLLANLAAAPFLDQLSQRVERLATGGVVSSGAGIASIAGETLSSFGAELQRLLFLAGLWLVISLAGLVVPGAQLVAGPALAVVTLLFLPLDYCGFALDRRRVGFRDRRRWLRAHLPTMLGFGGVAFLACLVPGLNLLIWPVMVSAGTLLVVRRTPSVAAEGGAPAIPDAP